MLHERLQRFHGIPVVHIGDEPCLRALPCLLSQVAWNGLGNLGDDLVQGVELVVVLPLGKRERGGVHACEVCSADAHFRPQRFKAWAFLGIDPVRARGGVHPSCRAWFAVLDRPHKVHHQLADRKRLSVLVQSGFPFGDKMMELDGSALL